MPPLEDRISTFKYLSEKIERKRVIWRYDPIILSEVFTPEFHLEKFHNIAKRLSGYTERCVISVVDIYRKTERGLRVLNGVDLNPLESPLLDQLLPKIHNHAKDCGMDIFSCAEGKLLEKYKIKKGKCIDDDLIMDLFNKNVSYGKDKNQRDLCGCIASRDIGMNNSCLHGCIYCYSTSSIKAARKNNLLHDPNSPMLIGEPLTDAKIIEVKDKKPKKKNLIYNELNLDFG